MDDPEIEEEEPSVGLFGPEARMRIKHEVLAALVVALGRLDLPAADGGPEETPATGGQNTDERRLWLEAQTGDGVQVVSPDGLNNLENGVTTSTDLEASSSNVIIKEDTVNPYFPIVPSSFSTPSSTSSTPSTSNSAHSSSGASPTVPPAGVSASSPLQPSHYGVSQNTPHFPPSPSPDSDATICLQVPSSPVRDDSTSVSSSSSSTTSEQVNSQFDQIPTFLLPRRLSRPKGPLAYQLNLGNMIHEEGEDIYYDEQATNGRWSTMRLVASVAANGKPLHHLLLYTLLNTELQGRRI
jgi:serine/threonine-protein phosphatase 4 regulatory subunit 1